MTTSGRRTPPQRGGSCPLCGGIENANLFSVK
nr:MAG TPA: restriction alleviation protein [Bacteriophage sp.]DAO57398.1 MAG TPA: restriction alleviation protein [Caudoviricetes sp.]